MHVITSLLLTFFYTSALPLTTAGQESWQVFWAGYPACSQECLASLSPSSGCLTTNNYCVCSNAAWIAEAAQTVGIQCPTDLQETANMFYQNCLRTNTPMQISVADFVAKGEQVASPSPTMPIPSPNPIQSPPVSTIPSLQTTQPLPPNSTPSHIPVVTIAGAAVGAVCIIMLCCGFFLWRQRRRGKGNRSDSRTPVSWPVTPNGYHQGHSLHSEDGSVPGRSGYDSELYGKHWGSSPLFPPNHHTTTSHADVKRSHFNEVKGNQYNITIGRAEQDGSIRGIDETE